MIGIIINRLTVARILILLIQPQCVGVCANGLGKDVGVFTSGVASSRRPQKRRGIQSRAAIAHERTRPTDVGDLRNKRLTSLRMNDCMNGKWDDMTISLTGQ